MKYSYIERREIGNNSYFYAVHVSREKGERRIRKCYLGPSSAYIHVTHLHQDEGLELKGLMNKNRAVEYMNALIDYIASNYHEIWSSEEASALALRSLASRLLKVADEICPQPQQQQPSMERIELSREDLEALIQYYGKRTKCSEKVRERARKLFEIIFSPGEKVLVIR
mgnify:FL=1